MHRPERGCFVTGTDTGVGKTVLAAAITASLRARGIDAVAHKPVITGLDEPGDPDWPPDPLLLAEVSGSTPELVSPLRFGPATSPHLAAAIAGRRVRPAELLDSVRAAAAQHEAVIVEGIGGLLVPFSEQYDVREFARDLGLTVVIAARGGLGTINHTLLTIEAARARELRLASVVLTPWPAAPSRLELSNRDTISRLGGIAVHTLGAVARPDRESLAQAGAGLPVEQWIAPGG